MSHAVSDATLIAYHHNRLSEREARDVAATLKADREAAVRHAALVTEISLLGVAVGRIDRLPAPPEAEDMIRAATTSGPRRSNRGAAWLSRGAAFQALAASLLLAIGVAAGFAVAEWRHARDAESQRIAAQDLEQARAHSRQTALNMLASGNSYLLAADDRSWTVEVMPVRTFQNANGAFCREYRETWQLGATVGESYRIACRDEVGNWQAVATLQTS